MDVQLDLEGMRRFLEELQSEDLAYYPNPGNAGDSLIAAGTYQAFKRLGLKPEVFPDFRSVDGKTVLLGGGGNLVPLYGEMAKVLDAVMARAKRVVVLPHTIRGHDHLLEKLPRHAAVFCREAESYAYVKERTTAEVLFSHDMAFHLDVGELYEKCGWYPDAFPLFDAKLKVLNQGIDRNRVGHFMRTDGERRDEGASLEGSVDLSTLYEFGVHPDNAEKSVFCLFEAIRRTSRVVTDRLHIGVASGLMRKACTLLDNNYRKNRSIYECSLSKLLPSVRMG